MKTNKINPLKMYDLNRLSYQVDNLKEIRIYARTLENLQKYKVFKEHAGIIQMIILMARDTGDCLTEVYTEDDCLGFKFTFKDENIPFGRWLYDIFDSLDYIRQEKKTDRQKKVESFWFNLLARFFYKNLNTRRKVNIIETKEDDKIFSFYLEPLPSYLSYTDNKLSYMHPYALVFLLQFAGRYNDEDGSISFHLGALSKEDHRQIAINLSQVFPKTITFMYHDEGYFYIPGDKTTYFKYFIKERTIPEMWFKLGLHIDGSPIQKHIQKQI